MKTSAVVMFADGKQDAHIGQKVMVKPGQSREKPYEATIIAIGRTYITVNRQGFRWNVQFNMDSGKEKSDVAPGELYSSPEAFALHCLKRELEQDVASHFEYGRAPGVSTEQLLEIQKILNTQLYQSGAFDALHNKKGK
nr:hypothetical protein BdHM001_34680 [Bdellovibrio sp. HM001]